MRSDTQVNRDKHRDVESLRCVTWINAYTKSAPYIFSNCSRLYSVKGTAGWLRCQKKNKKHGNLEGGRGQKIPKSVICLWRNECLCHKELGQKNTSWQKQPDKLLASWKTFVCVFWPTFPFFCQLFAALSASFGQKAFGFQSGHKRLCVSQRQQADGQLLRPASASGNTSLHLLRERRRGRPLSCREKTPNQTKPGLQTTLPLGDVS